MLRARRAAPPIRPAAAPVRGLLTWLYTGPLGHLYGGVADWATLLTRYLYARARGRDPRTGT